MYNNISKPTQTIRIMRTMTATIPEDKPVSETETETPHYILLFTTLMSVDTEGAF